MAFGLWPRLILLLCTWHVVRCTDVPAEKLTMECRDRYLLVAVDLTFVGEDPCFEAVDATGAYPITKEYGAECGYKVYVYPLRGNAKFFLRASYFSCMTDNQNDEVFTFQFNLITSDEEGEVVYALNQTCSPSPPLMSRELTCEEDYMEVSVRSDMTCTGGMKEDWNLAVKTGYDFATSNWQVMFHGTSEWLIPMNISEARELGYVFDLTYGRLVFRTPYSQPHAFTKMVDGIPVQVVHPTIFSRDSWMVLMVDLVTACSMHQGTYEGGRMLWEAPAILSPLASGLSGLRSLPVSMGANGVLLDQAGVIDRGYTVETRGAKVQITIPDDAKGGYRRSFVMDNMYHDVYIFDLYFEQLFVDDNYVKTRLRQFKAMATPLKSLLSLTENQSFVEEGVIAVYLGNFPHDVELSSVKLNGQAFTVAEANRRNYTISKVLKPNNTHGYMLRLSIEDPVVSKKLSRQGVIQYGLDVNYTMTIVPEEESYYQVVTISGVMKDVFPPTFNGVCSERGIGFTRGRHKFDYLWEHTIGPDPLSPELAAERGYVMHKDGQRLGLDVPLHSLGYTYKDINLKQFLGSFEILTRDAKTLAVQGTSEKSCPFRTKELVFCSTNGEMTVVANVSAFSGVDPSKATLMGKACRPKEIDESKVLFKFALNTCGTKVKIDKKHVTYENKIIFPGNQDKLDFPLKLTVTCEYTMSGLHRLFSEHRFEADDLGVGRVVYTDVAVILTDQQFKPVVGTYTQSTTSPETMAPTTIKKPAAYLSAIRPTVKYIQVASGQRVAKRLEQRRKGGNSFGRN